MGEEGVRPERAIHPELEALAGGVLGHPVDDRLRLFWATELLAVCLEDRLRLAG